MKRIAILFILCVSSGIMFSQTNRKNSGRTVELQKSYTSPQSKATPAEGSDYFGFDAKIKDVLLKESVLSAVPKKIQNQTKEEYLDVLNKWISNNPGLIKPEKKSTQIN